MRVPRKRTLWQRLKKYLEMPHLKRRDRNQRVAIVGMIIALAVYLVVLRPLIDLMFPDTLKKSSAPGKAAPPRKR